VLHWIHSFSIVVIVILFQQLAFGAAQKPIYVLHLNLGNTELSSQIQRELSVSLPGGPQRQVVIIRPNLFDQNNPFSVSNQNFALGKSRPAMSHHGHPAPVYSEKQLQWFESQMAQDLYPDVFIVNGHHIPALGFHSDENGDSPLVDQNGDKMRFRKKSLFTPTLHQSIQKYPILQRYFSRVKLVFVGGCWGLSNLEPRSEGDHGNYLTPEEIRELYKVDRRKAIGSSSISHSLEYQRWELATIYSGEYTRDARGETCVQGSIGEKCDKWHVDRVLPDYGLWDGSHMFNQPYLYKRSFPNAVAVFGFHRPSPKTPGNIWAAAFHEARIRTGVSNLLGSLLNENLPVDFRKMILQELRISWTKNSYLQNRQRASGSITPAFPELDADGPFAYRAGQNELPEAPKHAPYEAR
jgi:hypothetical protein